MLSKIHDLLFPAKAPILPPITFHEVTKEDMAEKYPDAFHDLYKGKEVGFLIKNFLSKDQVETILSNFDQVYKNDPAYTDVGFTYPPIFAEHSLKVKDLDQKDIDKANEEYFKRNEVFDKGFQKDFGVNVPSMLTSVFKQLAGHRHVQVPPGIGDRGRYPFGTFRLLKPDSGLIAIHTGNYFQDVFLKFYQHLSSIVNVKDQMSYFIVLQEAEEGGELSVFNFLWEDGQSKDHPAEDEVIYLPNGRKYRLDKDKGLQKIVLSPKVGDMILFQGGRFWHRVNPIKGHQNRITFGGFLGFSENEKTIYYWS